MMAAADVTLAGGLMENPLGKVPFRTLKLNDGMLKATCAVVVVVARLASKSAQRMLPTIFP